MKSTQPAVIFSLFMSLRDNGVRCKVRKILAEKRPTSYSYKTSTSSRVVKISDMLVLKSNTTDSMPTLYSFCEREDQIQPLIQAMRDEIKARAKSQYDKAKSFYDASLGELEIINKDINFDD